MIGAISALLGLACLIGAFGGAGVAWNSRHDDRPLFWKATLVAVVSVAVFFILPKPPRSGDTGGDCYIDWDGRSNPTVCD